MDRSDLEKEYNGFTDDQIHEEFERINVDEKHNDGVDRFARIALLFEIMQSRNLSSNNRIKEVPYETPYANSGSMHSKASNIAKVVLGIILLPLGIGLSKSTNLLFYGLIAAGIGLILAGLFSSKNDSRS